MCDRVPRTRVRARDHLALHRGRRGRDRRRSGRSSARMNSLVRGGRWQRARVRDSMAVNTTVQVTMPAMGESVTEGTVLEWHKQEGDPIDARRGPGRDLDRQGRRGGPVADRRHDRQGARRRGRHRRGRPAAVPRSSRRNGAGAGRGGAGCPRQRREASPAEAGGEIVDIVTPDRRRVGHRGHDPRVVGQGRRHRQRRRHGRRDLDRQGRHGAARPGRRHDHRDPRRRGRDRHRRPGHRADAGRRGRGEAAGAPRGNGAPGDRAAALRGAARRREGAKVTPVAARVAAAEGVDLGARHRHRPAAAGSRRTTSSTAAAAPAAAPPARAAVIKGGAAMLARYMDESRSIPTATSFRTITVTTMDGRRKELKNAGEKVSLHAPDRLRDRAGRRSRTCR